MFHANAIAAIGPFPGEQAADICHPGMFEVLGERN